MVNPGRPSVHYSGAGHGGSGGQGYGQSHAGAPSGDLYEPNLFGSCGGLGRYSEIGGNGGGKIWINVTGTNNFT